MYPFFRRWTLLIATTLLVACGAPHSYNGTLLEPPKALTPLQLALTDGGMLTLGQPSDAPTIVYFGYTNCPDYCPTTMGEWKLMRQQLGSQADQFRFVMVTIDPAHDTPAVLRRYLDTFDPAILGAIPSAEQLAQINADYGLGLDLTHSGHDPNAHGTYTYLLDRDGSLHLLLRADLDAAAMLADVRAASGS